MLVSTIYVEEDEGDLDEDDGCKYPAVPLLPRGIFISPAVITPGVTVTVLLY